MFMKLEEYSWIEIEVAQGHNANDYLGVCRRHTILKFFHMEQLHGGVSAFCCDG
jgi:hypothetical protein